MLADSNFHVVLVYIHVYTMYGVHVATLRGSRTLRTPKPSPTIGGRGQGNSALVCSTTDYGYCGIQGEKLRGD